MRHKLRVDDLNVSTFPTVGHIELGQSIPQPGDGPNFNMKPDPTDYLASCSGCTFVGLQCC